MRIYLLSILAVAFLWACANTSVYEAPEPTVMEMICDYTEWEGCENVPPPKVITSNIISPAVVGALVYGMYIWGEDYIFINPKTPPHLRLRVNLHETVHYMLYKLNKLDPYDRCKSEELARKVTAGVLDLNYNNRWRLQYGCEGFPNAP